MQYCAAEYVPLDCLEEHEGVRKLKCPLPKSAIAKTGSRKQKKGLHSTEATKDPTMSSVVEKVSRHLQGMSCRTMPPGFRNFCIQFMMRVHIYFGWLSTSPAAGSNMKFLPLAMKHASPQKYP